MATQKREQAKQQSPPTKQANRRPRVAPDPRKTQARVVKGLLVETAKSLMEKAKTGTLGDYIKLVQMQKDLDVEEPRDIKVGWVDHLEKDVEK